MIVTRSAPDMKSIFKQGQKGINASNVAVSIPDFVEPGEIDMSEPTISFTRNTDGSLTDEFEGTLQTVPTVNGPWTDVDATSPVNWSSEQFYGFARSKK